jgi:hypothetical protein
LLLLLELMPGIVEVENRNGHTPADLADGPLKEGIICMGQMTPLMVAVLRRSHGRVQQLLGLKESDPCIEVVHNGIRHTALSLSNHQPQYFWSKESCELTNEYLKRSLHWSPDNHRFFPPAFRKG